MKLGQLLRYSSSRDTTSEIVDGLSNYYHATLYPGRALPLLERGINPIARVKSPDGLRIPAVLIRSSPHKAGSTTAPWQDLFDTDNGKIRYFGDNRPEAQTGPELAPGNKLLNSLVGQLWAESTKVRLNATPLIFFRGAALAGRQKGQIEFHGYGLIEQAALVSQWDATSSSYFTNYVYDFLVFSLVHENEAFDWGWINTRRDPKASDLSSLSKAPAAWRRWAQEGPQSIPQIRRSVAKFRVVKKSEQLPSGCQRSAGSPGRRTAGLPVGGHETSRWADSNPPGRPDQTSGFTPFPAVASASRSEPPSVRTRWAWWRKRSTAAVASVLGMMVSKPAGCRLLVSATLRFS